MASTNNDTGLIPESAGDQQMQQALTVEVGSEAELSVPIALQVAWSAVLGCYNGTNEAVFDLIDIRRQEEGQKPTFAGTTIQVHLQRNGSVEAAMKVLSQVTSQPAAKPSEALMVLLDVLAIDPSTVPSLHRDTYPKYHLSVECCVDEKRMVLRAIYTDSKWPSATVRFMLYQLRHAMNLIATSSSGPVNALQIISVEGQRQWMDWSRDEQRTPQLKTVWSVIEQQCKTQPLKPAIESWDGRATYAELEQRVSAVAERLLQLGLEPGTFVGLLLEKSMTATVVILGVIRTGFAFVLLDASQPTQRLKSMCNTAQVATIVASPKHMDAGSSLGLTVHSTDDFPLLPQGESPHVRVRPNSSLYAGFTSGSTGEPKGFVIEHGTFATGLDEYCAGLNLNPGSRVFQFASYSFVVSITGQLAPLSRGACLCIPSQFQLEHDLASAIQQLGADWIALTPSVARTLDAASVSSLQTIVMVGEEVSPLDVEKWKHLNLYSLYGQSENSKGTMIAKKSSDHAVAGIGKPFHANAWIVHRDDDNVLLPIGAEGELVIESPCLTRGYINNDDQTRESFVTNPAWVKGTGRQGDVRIFKTGDIARRNAADGSFQLLGRKGTRTKIRGQRIELGEVEYQIRCLLPGAESIAVDIVCTAEDTLEQSPMVVAFILMKAENRRNKSPPSLLAPATPSFLQQSLLLKAKLQDALPSFMVPAAYVELARMPKTGTGKLDRRVMCEAAAKLSRRALLEYSAVRAADREPRSYEEIILRDICEQVLQLPRGEVGMNDTFIDLGGDSLIARHLITSARSSGLRITMQDIFQPATLTQIAQRSQDEKEPESARGLGSGSDWLSTLRGDFISSLPESLCEAAVEDVLPTLELQATYTSHRVVDCFPLHISGSVDVMQLRRACRALVASHPILRTVFHYFGGRLVQVILREVDVPFLVQMCDSLEDAVHWVEDLGVRESKKRYDIDKPILGFTLVTTVSQIHHILVMRLCHGQYDGHCLRPFIQDIWAAYQNLPIPLEAGFKRHVEYCFRQRSPAAYNVWRRVLEGSRPSVLWQPAPAMDDQVATQSKTKIHLPNIQPLARATAASMVKAAWFEAQWLETGQDDIVFGELLHVWSGANSIIGPCINVIPVRVQNFPRWTRRKILHGIQEQHAKTSSADALGWSDIVANCTDWPVATVADSVVLHQNFDRHVEARIDGIVCRKGMPIFSPLAVHSSLLITLPNEDSMAVVLFLSSKYRGQRDPSRLLANFARALQLLEHHPDEPFGGKGL